MFGIAGRPSDAVLETGQLERYGVCIMTSRLNQRGQHTDPFVISANEKRDENSACYQRRRRYEVTSRFSPRCLQ